MYRDCFRHLYSIHRKRIDPTPDGHLRLQRLERPVPWPDDLIDEVWAAQYQIQQYPDYDAFYERLAQFIDVPKERIVIGNGIEDFIRTLMILCLNPGDSVAFTWPTCAMFEIYARVFKAKPVKLITFPNCKPTVEHILEKLTSGVKLVILPNPGQPVETYYDLEGLSHLARRCLELGAVLAVDEAYYGFGADTAMDLLHSFDNVVILRTFSKAFGAAGIRLGYAVGRPHAIKPIDSIRPSGEVSGPSMAAATVLMDRWQTHVAPGIADICHGRDWLREAIRSVGVNASGSLANHVLVEHADADEIGNRLRAKQVHVKYGFPSPLDKHLLITAGPLSVMREAFKAFKEALGE